MIKDTLDTFAELFAYPREDYGTLIGTSQARITAMDPATAPYLDKLAAFGADAGQGEIEELYTRTFDMNPACALELGWHLYGEDYDRGAFLVTVRDMMRRHGVEENGELPDHITHILPLLGRLEEEEAIRFSRRQALPAIERILLNFKDTEHPFRALLEGVRNALTTHFGPADKVPASAFACPAPYEDAPSACSGLSTGPCGSPPQTSNPAPKEM